MSYIRQLKCQVCGSTLIEKESNYKCPACGAFFEKKIEENTELMNALQDAERLLNLPFPRFEDAEEQFSLIVKNFPNDSAGYWGLVRAKYGIKLETDFDGKKVPSCYKTSYEDFRDDSIYKKALMFAESSNLKDKYKEYADKIAKVTSEWKNKTQDLNYDVFICFKASDDNNQETEDAKELKNLYIYLTNKGLKVFFSPITLNQSGIFGAAVEPYIFNALDKSNMMLVYGSSPEYLSTTWVQNEWSRYLRAMSRGKKLPNSLLVVYKSFNPKELPISIRDLQAIDATSGHWHEDVYNSVSIVLENIKYSTPIKRIAIDKVELGKKVSSVENTIETIELGQSVEKKRALTLNSGYARRKIENSNAFFSVSDEQRLDAAIQYLSDEAYDDAESFFKECFCINDRNGRAYWGYLCCQIQNFEAYKFVYYNNYSIRAETVDFSKLEDFDLLNKAIEYSSDVEIAEKIAQITGNGIVNLIEVNVDKADKLYVILGHYALNSIAELDKKICSIEPQKNSNYSKLFDSVLKRQSDVDEYISLAKSIVKNAISKQNFIIAKNYVDAILKVDENNYDALFYKMLAECYAVSESEFIKKANQIVDFSFIENKIPFFDKKNAELILKLLWDAEVYSLENTDYFTSKKLFDIISKFNFKNREKFIDDNCKHLTKLAVEGKIDFIKAIIQNASYKEVDWHIRTLKECGDKALTTTSRFSCAESCYKMVLNLEENNPFGLSGLLRCKMDMGSNPENTNWSMFSKEEFEKILAYCPTKREQQTIVDFYVSESKKYISDKNEFKRHIEACVASFDTLIRYYPETANTKYLNALSSFGKSCVKAGLFEYGIKYLNLFLSENKNEEPDHTILWNILLAKLECKTESEFLLCDKFSKDMPEYKAILLAAYKDKDAREKYRDLAINNETSVAKAKQKIIDDLRKLQEKKEREAREEQDRIKKSREDRAVVVEKYNECKTRSIIFLCLPILMIFLAIFCAKNIDWDYFEDVLFAPIILIILIIGSGIFDFVNFTAFMNSASDIKDAKSLPDTKLNLINSKIKKSKIYMIISAITLLLEFFLFYAPVLVMVFTIIVLIALLLVIVLIFVFAYNKSR